MFTIFGGMNCVYCVRAKETLEAKGIDFVFKNVADFKDEWQELAGKNGFRTIPQIWKDDKHIGGFDDLVVFFNNEEK